MSIAVVHNRTLYTDTYGVYAGTPNKVNKLTSNKRLAMACIGSVLFSPFSERALNFFDGKLQAFYASGYDGDCLLITKEEYITYFGKGKDHSTIILMTNDLLFILKDEPWQKETYLEMLDPNTRFAKGNGGDLFLFGLLLGGSMDAWLDEMKKYEPTSGGDIHQIHAADLIPYPTALEI